MPSLILKNSLIFKKFLKFDLLFYSDLLIMKLNHVIRNYIPKTQMLHYNVGIYFSYTGQIQTLIYL